MDYDILEENKFRPFVEKNIGIKILFYIPIMLIFNEPIKNLILDERINYTQCPTFFWIFGLIVGLALPFVLLQLQEAPRKYGPWHNFCFNMIRKNNSKHNLINNLWARAGNAFQKEYLPMSAFPYILSLIGLSMWTNFPNRELYTLLSALCVGSLFAMVFECFTPKGWRPLYPIINVKIDFSVKTDNLATLLSLIRLCVIIAVFYLFFIGKLGDIQTLVLSYLK